MQEISWKCLNLGLRRLDREVVLVKICNDLLPTAINLQKWKWQAHDSCCLCGMSETRDHMLLCKGESRRKWRIKTIDELQKRMKTIDTKFGVENTICSAISDWFETGKVLAEDYPEEYHDAIRSQEAIGWRQVFHARISKLWMEHQGNTKLASGRVRMDYIWGASIVETCLRMMIELWEMRNEEVHGKEEAAIEQKRKERAAITVRALHKLEEQARPSNSILFYQDVEATIERVPAATLEAYIAMSTRAINNSVQK